MSNAHSIPSVRHSLFRTLFHEVGHWVDYLESVQRPASSAADWTDAYLAYSRQYDSKPVAEKEAFAHAYADRLRKELVDRNRIPFPRILDARGLKRDGLAMRDFCIE